jgi:hypothetical protein
MGYDTRLVFVTGTKNKKTKKLTGYCSVVATMEMACIAYNAFGALIDQKREALGKHNQKVIAGHVQETEDLGKEIYGADGEHTDEFLALDIKEQERKKKVYYTSRKTLEQMHPYIYEGGDGQRFLDSYGDVLMIATLEEVRLALAKDAAKQLLEEGQAYRRYAPALALCDALKDFGEDVEVVMYGH